LYTRVPARIVGRVTEIRIRITVSVVEREFFFLVNSIIFFFTGKKITANTIAIDMGMKKSLINQRKSIEKATTKKLIKEDFDVI
jgi:hypothetical protein